MKTLTIEWLNKCRCGNKLHTVKTARGNESALWDDDAVKCNSCGRGGIIQVCEGQARVLWETDEEMAENKPMSTITKEFTKEQLIEKLQHRIAVAAKYPDLEEAQIDAAILKIALASLEAEPYGYVHKAAYETAGSCGLSNDHEAYRDSSTHIAVYTAPPTPVSVPDAATAIRACMEEFPESVHDIVEECAAIAESACRAAMLQGAEPVTTANKLPEGWVAVPIEPTAEMMAEAKRWTGLTSTAEIVYREMIAAAPQQEAE
ncbi:hypothetical protein [Enterobacter cloacae]|uniref:hypothetical protein n=1 Tax=Enterobacter cloacae TaxID=550 RepID=UPI00320493F8